MAKFTKLNIGDSVASGGGRAWKKLSAEEPIDLSTIVGVWKLNNTIRSYNDSVEVVTDTWVQSGTWSSGIGSITYPNGSGMLTATIKNFSIYCPSSTTVALVTINNTSPTTYPYITYTSTKVDCYPAKGTNSAGGLIADYSMLREITFNENALKIYAPSQEKILKWLKANATKIA